MTRIPVLIGLVLLLCAPAGQQPPAWKSWKEVVSNAGHYRVRYELEKDPPPRDTLFGLEAYVLDPQGKELRPKVALLVDGDMPEHGHGLVRVPEVAQRPDGGFAVSGLRLHMPGKWQIYLDLVEGAHTERAQFDLVLE